MQESPHEREGVDNKYFRVLTGLVGLIAFSYFAVELMEPLFFFLRHGGEVDSSILSFYSPTIAAFVGWGGLVYACWIRSGRITDTALAFVLAQGICGLAISYLALGLPLDPLGTLLFDPLGTVLLTGIWILNGLCIVWVVQKVHRIMAAANSDAEEPAR